MTNELQDAPNHLTVSVHLEIGTPGDYGSEMLDLVVRSDKCVDEEGGADHGKVEGEEQSHEDEESHRRCTRGGENR